MLAILLNQKLIRERDRTEDYKPIRVNAKDRYLTEPYELQFTSDRSEIQNLKSTYRENINILR